MNNIYYVTDPNRLKMIWQSSGENRKKFVVGELVRSGLQVSLSYLRYNGDFYEAVMNGFRGHPAFRIDDPVHQHNVIEVLSKRLPPRNRADFPAYLVKHRLGQTPYISDFALLGYTGGYLPGDGFSFVVDFAFENPPYMFLMEISGFRYYDGMNIEISQLLNQPVYFEAEPSNIHDALAVKIMFMGMKIGYVPRYYLPLFHHWLNNFQIYSNVERIDGTMQKPQVHLLMNVQSRSTHKIR